MKKLHSKHFLTGEELTSDELRGLLSLAKELKNERRSGKNLRTDLQGKVLALLFEKPSLRTHLSFSIAAQELGMLVVETHSSLRKKEDPEDVARVVAGYTQAVMVRTHEHSIVERMAKVSSASIINGLTDAHHPCQILADLQTLEETYGSLKGVKFSYIGDGNNILQSLLLLLPILGVEVHYACPKGFEPNSLIVKKALKRAKEGGGKLQAYATPEEAVRGTNAIYTDVWTSMGFESETAQREKAFAGYQLNSKLHSLAAANALIMHCMPMIRGKEITSEMADHPHSALSAQSENRLHAQKALLIGLLGAGE